MTNIDFLRRLCFHPAFKDADLRTDFIEQHRAALFSPLEHKKALAQLGLYLSLRPTDAASVNASVDPSSPWQATDAWRVNAPSRWSHCVTIGEEPHTISVQQDSIFTVTVSDTTYRGEARLDGSTLHCELDGTKSRVEIFEQALVKQRELVVFGDKQSLTCRTLAPNFGDASSASGRANFKAPMNGTLAALFVEAGQQVEAETTLVIMEAMKMEHAIKAPTPGTVTDVFYSVGDLVDGGSDLLNFVPFEQT